MGAWGPGPLYPLKALIATPVTVVWPGFVNGGQSEGAKLPSGGGTGVGGGCPPPTVGRFLKMCVYQNTIFSHY